MSSGYGRNGGGGQGNPPGNNRRRNKKYGLNLYQLQKAAPTAPPVPTIITNAPSTKNLKPSNGLLLLSKKNPAGSGGLLVGKEIVTADGGKQTANDVLFAKAQSDAAGGQGGEAEEGKSKTSVAAWGNKGEKQPTQAPVDLSLEELSLKSPAYNQTTEEEHALKYDENTTLLVLAPKGSLSKEKPATNEPASAPEHFELKTATITDKSRQKDEQQQYMSNLAKERAGRLKSEEEERATQQKERAAKRLKELEVKRLEQKNDKERQKKTKKKQPRFDGPPTSITIGKDAPKKPPPISVTSVPSEIFSRKEVSHPKFVLEPLGKPKKIMTHSDKLSSDKAETSVKSEVQKKLYDPNRPYSSLVGGKTQTKPKEAKSGGSVKSGKSEESNAAKSNSRGKAPTADKPPVKKEELPSVGKIITLSSFEDRDRGTGRGAAGGRMLFDPTSGSLVAAPSGEIQQQQQPSLVVGGVKPKQQFPKSPGGNAKNADTKQQQLTKKSDGRSRSQKFKSRFPRTRGVQYKKDERGNYINVDECEADCGYGQHSVPGGRVKNQAAYAKLSERNEVHQAGKPSTKLNADAPSFYGFQIQKDSTFLQQQTDFEAQQQRILEDAWASLEEAAPSREEQLPEEPEAHQPQTNPGVNSRGEDAYAAALAISPTMIGLGSDKEEPFDVSKFALEGESNSLPNNRFGSLGGGGSRLLGSTTWTTNTSTNTGGTTLGQIAGLTGWNFDPNATDFTPNTSSSAAAPSSNTSNAESEQLTNSNTFINLNGWGSSGFDYFAFGGNKESG